MCTDVSAKKKAAQEIDLTDSERRILLDGMLIVGCVNGVSKMQMQRYSTDEDAWTIIKTIDQYYSPRIHCIDEYLYLLACDVHSRAIKVDRFST